MPVDFNFMVGGEAGQGGLHHNRLRAAERDEADLEKIALAKTPQQFVGYFSD